jgi:V/A-type H+-transporting ATPase subunit I
MIRPRKMKRVQMTVLKSDVNTVIEYLGRNGTMHFCSSGDEKESADYIRIRELMEKLRAGGVFLGVELPTEPDADSALPGEAEEALAETVCAAIGSLQAKETAAYQEKQRIEDTYREAKAFSNLNAPFADLDQLSYLTLRVGRIDPKVQTDVKERLGDRAVIIPLGKEGDGRILAASSRKGRFALDSELKKFSFEAISVPENYQGVPSELLDGLEGRLNAAVVELEKIAGEKARMRDETQAVLRRLVSAMLMALAAEKLKSQLVSTSSIYLLTGWVPSDMISRLAADLAKITGGRTAIQTYTPNEIAEVRDGEEKVPVSLKHGAFVKGFEGVVFSYGAPLYGSIDPTPIVAVFFTLLFGIMFGDLGQGFALFLAGILTSKYGPRRLAKFKSYSTPLIAVGAASMVMGLLTGEVFTIENLLVAPTRFITQAITGVPSDRILIIMPLAEHGGSVKKLFYFFGFTIGIGVIFNSLGLVINIVNRFVMKKYEAAFFSKTGLAGLSVFWYVIFIALRCIFGGRFESYDFIGIGLPLLCIFFGPVIWRCIAREKPVFQHGLMTFVMEGFVEILETASTYISNTVSFLRVGAFALSHAVLSYIVFRFTEELHTGGGPVGSSAALLILIFGNLVIIVLEGMIVAIQVVRLQYYEFFNKFFTETGVEFVPFRFRNSGAGK